MPMNPATDEIVRSVRNHLELHPVGDLERVAISRITAEAQLQLPLAPEILGEILIQFASLMRSLVPIVRDAERKAGRFVQSLPGTESTAAGIAANIAMLAGIQLYTGEEI